MVIARNAWSFIKIIKGLRIVSVKRAFNKHYFKEKGLYKVQYFDITLNSVGKGYCLGQ
jgi:hypothetical protein